MGIFLLGDTIQIDFSIRTQQFWYLNISFLIKNRTESSYYYNKKNILKFTTFMQVLINKAYASSLFFILYNLHVFSKYLKILVSVVGNRVVLLVIAAEHWLIKIKLRKHVCIII